MKNMKVTCCDWGWYEGHPQPFTWGPLLHDWAAQGRDKPHEASHLLRLKLVWGPSKAIRMGPRWHIWAAQAMLHHAEGSGGKGPIAVRAVALPTTLPAMAVGHMMAATHVDRIVAAASPAAPTAPAPATTPWLVPQRPGGLEITGPYLGLLHVHQVLLVFLVALRLLVALLAEFSFCRLVVLIEAA